MSNNIVMESKKVAMNEEKWINVKSRKRENSLNQYLS